MASLMIISGATLMVVALAYVIDELTDELRKQGG